MVIRQLDNNQITEALELAWEVFLEFEGPEYSTEGIGEFKDFLDNKEEIARLCFYGAFDQGALLGVLAVRGSHISLFFVKKAFHRKGIAKELFLEMLGQTEWSEITVNASPYAKIVYEKLGFTATTSEQTTNGIRYIPMVYMNDLMEKLKIDCEKCSGLCCVALFCMKTDGFPKDKAAGTPCKFLDSGFRCRIHSQLAEKDMRGCLAYDCFGAGQKVTQACYPDMNWKISPQKADEIFRVFLTVFQLHQMEWYLLQSLELASDKIMKSEIKKLIVENEKITAGSPDQILGMDIAEYRENVNKILKEVTRLNASRETDTQDFFGKNLKGENLSGMNLSMAVLIAADLNGCKLQGTNLLGADMRDANIENADLSSSIFLTQMQVNSAKGNSKTKLPANLTRPTSWQE